MKWLKFIALSIPILFLGSCAGMIALFYWEISQPPEIAEGVESVNWLPEEATDINYCLSYGYTAYEFQISENGFLEWASEVAYEPASEYVFYLPVTEVSAIEEKYFFPINRYNNYRSFAEDYTEDMDFEEHQRTTSIEIENGLWGQARSGSAGGYSIGYDRSTGTAYWQTNPR